MLLVTAAERLSTAAVFAELDRASRLPPGAWHAPARARPWSMHLAVALRSGLDGAGWLTWLIGLRDANDLWPAAARLSPSLATARDALERASAGPSC